MRRRERIVVDTNCLVSRLLLADSIPGLAVRKAVDASILLVSEATMEELAEKYGHARRAFLVVAVLGAFLVDFTNSVIITAMANFFNR